MTPRLPKLPRAGNYTLGVILLAMLVLCIALGLQAESRFASGLWFTVAVLLVMPALIARAFQDDASAYVNKRIEEIVTEMRESPRPAPSPDAQRQPEAQYVVTVDPQRIACRPPAGDEQSIAWDDLDAVMIETNDTGPWGCDVWWLLLRRGGSGSVEIPQGATGEPLLLDALQALPGFDNAKLIDAMSCTDNRRFLCWRRTDQISRT